MRYNLVQIENGRPGVAVKDAAVSAALNGDEGMKGTRLNDGYKPVL
jgi:hypothetical protein